MVTDDHPPGVSGRDTAHSATPPARGERYARRGYGYQDKAATELIFRAVKAEQRSGGRRLVGVRLADERAGRVDDCVVVWENRVLGNSIKWRRDGKPMAWAELVGVDGILKELADGYRALGKQWGDRTVEVRLQTSYPASESETGRLVTGLSVAEFVREHWVRGPSAAVNEVVSVAWRMVEVRTGLQGGELEKFVAACELSLGVQEPRVAGTEDEETRAYRRQFKRLHDVLATWLTLHPESEMVGRHDLLAAVRLGPERAEFVQSFPTPPIPYRRNEQAARALRNVVAALDGGYIAVSGTAGGGKSTLVQDVLGADPSIVFVPYFAFLPDGEGAARDRGEALPFYRDVVARLDRVFRGRASLGIESVRHGRETLRRHMSSAHERFTSDGVKTVLLMDGLDHVKRESNLAESILRELPAPDEIASGFLIVLSGRPEAFLADSIGPDVSGVVAETGIRRVVVDGLSREEVHQIALAAMPGMTAEERDCAFRECGGNPLFLTYWLKALRLGEGRRSVAWGGFDGDIDRFYRRAFSVPLRNPETRRLLGLLCRASSPVSSRWLQDWPERPAVEELYESVLAPFMKEEHGDLRFVHSSLISFLTKETGPKLPGADADAAEASYHSDLADRTAGRACGDALGRAHVHHLAQAGRSREVLDVVTSSWLRGAVRAFVPYVLVRPVVLETLRVAWDLEEYGDVARLVLADAELAQRGAHMEGGELADAFLKLGDHELALAQVRANGMLLVDDEVALNLARELWFYAREKELDGLQERSKKLYADAKPLGYLLGGGRVKLESRDYELERLLEAWCESSPLFERVGEVIERIRRLDLEVAAAEGKESNETSRKAGLLLASLKTVVSADLGADAERLLLAAIRELDEPEWELGASLVVSAHGETTVSARALRELWNRCGNEPNLSLEVAERLQAMGSLEPAKSIVRELDEAGIEGYGRSGDIRGHVDVSFIVSLTRLRNVLGLPAAGAVVVGNDVDEGTARVVTAARRMGVLQAEAGRGTVPNDLRHRFAQVLFYESRPIAQEDYKRGFEDVVGMSKRALLQQLVVTARGLGLRGLRALRDVVTDATATGAFLGWYRRRFASAFRKGGVMGVDEAVALGLSWTSDAEDEDPRLRQEACLEIAAFVRRVGSDGWREWVERAGRASAGAGSHKDYRMADLAVWLDRAIGPGPPSKRQAAVIGRFLQALEVSGGAGGRSGAEQVLRTVLRAMPRCAAALAVEMIDRDLVGLSGILEALVAGGSETGASPGLLAAVVEELLSLVALDGIGEAAGAVLDISEHAEGLSVAERLMCHVRTNCLPSTRLRVARDIQQVLGRHGWDDVDLGGDLTGGEGSDEGRFALPACRWALLDLYADGGAAGFRRVGVRMGSESRRKPGIRVVGGDPVRRRS